VIEVICQAWEQAIAIEPVSVEVPCRSAVVLASSDATPRFAYLSVGSPIEHVAVDSAQIVDRSGSQIALAELAARLLDGEVAALTAPLGPIELGSAAQLTLPEAFVDRRQNIREQHVLARFLLRQIGLEEVSSHRGAPAELYHRLAALWSLDLSLCVDPAMLLTLGADRQRYVDSTFTDRAKDRLPRALGRLHDLGVRSYPRLVIV